MIKLITSNKKENIININLTLIVHFAQTWTKMRFFFCYRSLYFFVEFCCCGLMHMGLSHDIHSLFIMSMNKYSYEYYGIFDDFYMLIYTFHWIISNTNQAIVQKGEREKNPIELKKFLKLLFACQWFESMMKYGFWTMLQDFTTFFSCWSRKDVDSR